MKTRNPLSDDLEHILHRTGSLLQCLDAKKVFLTGGTGFFGKWLLESFLWANQRSKLNIQVHVLSRDPKAFALKYPHLTTGEGVVFHQGDVRNFDFPQEQFDFILHAATEASEQLNQENPLSMMDTIIEGTRRVLEFSRICGAKRFLLTSSGAVYGKQPPELSHISEEYLGAPDPLQSSSAYGEGKRVAECLCSAYSKMYGIETVIARCFAFVGPYLPLDTHFAIGNFILNCLKNEPIDIKGDGTPLRSYMYMSDFVHWLLCILLLGENRRAYNVGSDQAISISELAALVQHVSGCTQPVIVCRKAVPSVPPARYVPSIDLAKKTLGLTLQVTLPEAIRKTLAWHLARKNALD